LPPRCCTLAFNGARAGIASPSIALEFSPIAGSFVLRPRKLPIRTLPGQATELRKGFMPRKRHCFSQALFCAVLVLAARPACAQDQAAQVASAAPDSATSIDTSAVASWPAASAPKPAPQASAQQHKLGPFEFTVNWRFRGEAWDWFEAAVPAQN